MDPAGDLPRGGFLLLVVNTAGQQHAALIHRRGNAGLELRVGVDQRFVGIGLDREIIDRAGDAALLRHGVAAPRGRSKAADDERPGAAAKGQWQRHRQSYHTGRSQNGAKPCHDPPGQQCRDIVRFSGNRAKSRRRRGLPCSLRSATPVRPHRAASANRPQQQGLGLRREHHGGEPARSGSAVNAPRVRQMTGHAVRRDQHDVELERKVG